MGSKWRVVESSWLNYYGMPFKIRRDTVFPKQEQTFHHALEYRCIYITYSDIVPNIALLTGFFSLTYPYYIACFLIYIEKIHFISSRMILHLKKNCRLKVLKIVISHSYYYGQIQSYGRNHLAFTTNPLLITDLV